MTAGIVIVLLVAVVGVYAWAVLGTSAMSAQGYVALALGIVATLGLGIGLMALVFFSNRQGYDERAGRSGKDGGGGRVD